MTWNPVKISSTGFLDIHLLLLELQLYTPCNYLPMKYCASGYLKITYLFNSASEILNIHIIFVNFHHKFIRDST